MFTFKIRDQSLMIAKLMLMFKVMQHENLQLECIQQLVT